MGSTNSVPKYIFGIIAIVLLAIIFIFTVQVPFSKAQPELEKQHQSDASQLKIYQDAYADRVNLASRVSSMKAQYEKDSKELFVNATKSPEDIMKMLNSSKVLPTTYSVSEQVLDDKGRSSSSGEPLYSTNISISFDSLDETQLLTVLDYFEAPLPCSSPRLTQPSPAFLLKEFLSCAFCQFPGFQALRPPAHA